MSDLQLLTKFTLGDQELQNRLVLAPMTRARYVLNLPRTCPWIDGLIDQSLVFSYLCTNVSFPSDLKVHTNRGSL
jgi:hypothetical protein